MCSTGRHIAGSPVSARIMWLCSPHACASKPPRGSCRSSSSVVNFRCSMTRRFASPGAHAVTWLHNQCAWRVKHSWVHFLTDSLCVLCRFGSTLSLFHLWLFLCVGCRFCFVSVLVRIDSTLVVVSSTWKCTVIVDVCLPWKDNPPGTPKNTGVMLVALCCSSGPLRREEALRVLGLPHRRSCFFT